MLGNQIGKPLDLQTVIDTIPSPVVCALPDGTVEFVNQGQNVLLDAQKGTVSLSPFDVSLVATP
jgi:hypothetical protein